MAKIFKPAKSLSLVGKSIDVVIERLDINGIGVGKFKNKSVFVSNALVGEKVQAKVTEQTSKFIKAKPLKISQVSEKRITPKCRFFLQCGGCDLQHISAEEQLSFKQGKVSELLSRVGLSQLPWQKTVVESPWSYRRKARIGVQYNKLGEPTVGFRQTGTNNLTPISYCEVLLPELADVFPKLKQTIELINQPKSIGHIEVLFESQVFIIVRQLHKLSDVTKHTWLSAAQENSWHVAIDDGKSVVPLTPSFPRLRYSLEEINIAYSSDDFIQVNHAVNTRMVEQACEWLALNSEDMVLDLFCGLGNFSLSMAKRAKQVVGVEGVQAMVDKAGKNSIANNIENCDFYQLDLNNAWNEQPWANKAFNKVLLDPARAGAFEACQQLAKFSADKILYVSCDPTSLAKDSTVLIENGYKIVKIGLIDMFAQTKHVETMVLFERN
ncbi:23S rRNA (uracil(1939)-C(5))-methyltransferase RlmD [Thalassotalea euphylliae]|uniref:23S rRNA (uracil(1939)-C(5))-methyltransferase RlmD n=1 Tax=Thalassotalea euphylliae TaxID=1655234 RepID=UPI00363E1632